MSFITELRKKFETEEKATVGNAFGATRKKIRDKYSIPTIRDWVLSQQPFGGKTPIEISLKQAASKLSKPVLKIVVGNLIRFSFLIELTNLKVGSVKIKTRWLPGRILISEQGSYKPVEGTFQPGDDPRAASFKDCAQIFAEACNLICGQVQLDPNFKDLLLNLSKYNRVSYESPITYIDPLLNPLHRPGNITLAHTTDLEWLLKAREILSEVEAEHRAAIKAIETNKLKVKVYLTDRSKTGEDMTNRAKRWEVLCADFQHATLEECWSVERKLTEELVGFEGFPDSIRQGFIAENLIDAAPDTCCPITLDPLTYADLAVSALSPEHGKSGYQVGHRRPLKSGGKHTGDNVCWQSEDGNRIQGNLTIEQTGTLIDRIAQNRQLQASQAPSAHPQAADNMEVKR
jgi:hypothetical protein